MGTQITKTYRALTVEDTLYFSEQLSYVHATVCAKMCATVEIRQGVHCAYNVKNTGIQ
jgi:hypothetical protein